MLVRTGSVDEGEGLLREAYRLSDATSGPQHPDTQRCARELGMLLQSQGNEAFPDAELALEKLVAACELLRVAFPEGHPQHGYVAECEGMAAGCRAFLESQRNERKHLQTEPEPEPGPEWLGSEPQPETETETD